MEFLASQGKLAKECPIESCTGYAPYECGENCDKVAEIKKLDKVIEDLDYSHKDEEDVKACSDCGTKEKDVESCKCCTIQSELKRFLDLQEAGLDTSFRCLRCRDYRECLKGAGQERMSMIQEAQQQMIRQSVFIDQKEGKAVAKLPF